MVVWGHPDYGGSCKVGWMLTEAVVLLLGLSLSFSIC